MYISRKPPRSQKNSLVFFFFRERKNESRTSMLKLVKYEHMSLYPRIPK